MYVYPLIFETFSRPPSILSISDFSRLSLNAVISPVAVIEPLIDRLPFVSRPVAPVSPFAPGSPFCPWGPVVPVSPFGPWGPVAPVFPLGPREPVAPVSPLTPGSPMSPFAPGGIVKLKSTPSPDVLFTSTLLSTLCVGFRGNQTTTAKSPLRRVSRNATRR